MATPLVSILLPVGRVDAWLGECLESIVAQSLEDWECVVVLDGVHLAERFTPYEAALDERFRVFAQRSRGLVATLNDGWTRCRGQYVARMDGDDRMHPDRLRAQTEALAAHPRWLGVGAHPRLFPPSELGPGMQRYESWLCNMREPADVWRERFVECPLVHPSLMLRRAAFTEAPYRDRGWPEDYDLELRLLGKGPVLGVVTEPLLAWRHSPGRLQRVDPRYTIEQFTRCRAHFLAEQFLGDREEYLLWGYGDTGKSLGAALARLGRSFRWVVDLHPGRIGNRIHGAEVISPSRILDVPADFPIIASVAGAEARAEIRACLDRVGRIEGVDYVCAA